ncbi:Uncharacterised protein [Shigella sonnei]|nr:Uncharacterised protein [Shigella sonnei]
MLQRRTLGNVVIDINHFLNIAITVRYPTHFHEMGFATGSALPSFQLLQRIFPLCRHLIGPNSDAGGIGIQLFNKRCFYLLMGQPDA